MTTVTATTGMAGAIMPDAGAVQALAAQLRGALLAPLDAGYDDARAIWNAMIDRRPGLIARCAGTADVVAAVNFARDHDLLVSVRGGGHNIAGNAVCDDGLMIDLSAMNAVHIDAANRRAYVEPGATLRDFDHEAQAVGLATPLGINSTTGISGLTLGGGFGWLSRKYGLTADNLVRAEVVTADGRRLSASAGENGDLFWAIRGGGGNFGIVTLFEFELHPVGPDVLAGLIVYPFDQAKRVLTKWRDFTQQAPEDLSAWVVMRQAPPLPFLPAEVHGKEVVVVALLYAGKPEDGQALIAPLRELGRPVGEHVGVMPYAAWQQAFDPLLTPGARNYWKSHNFAEVSDGLMDVLIEQVGKLPSPHCEVFVGQLGGAVNRVAADATAYPHRDANYVMNVHGRWETAAEDQRGMAWARGLFEAATPYAQGGTYVNFMPQDDAGRVAAAYGSNYDRLTRIKRKYDPGNLFRMNQNIPPAG